MSSENGKTIKNNTYCCVPQCKSKGTKNPYLSFHLFPSDLKRRLEWIKALKIGKPVSDRMCVCSSHFEKNDYILPGRDVKKKRLKKTAIPSLKLPVADFQKLQERKQNANFRKKRCDAIFPLKNKELLNKVVQTIQRKNITPDHLHAACSNHFNLVSSLKGYENVRILKDDAIPSIFDISDHSKKQKNRILKSRKVIDNKTASTSVKNINKVSPETEPDLVFISPVINTYNSDEVEKNSQNMTIYYDREELQMAKDETTDENTSDSDENTSDSDEIDDFPENTVNSDCSSAAFNSIPSNSEEVLKQKLKDMTERYEKTQMKLQLCQERCKQYVKQVSNLTEVLDHFKQINSVTDDS